MSGNSLDWENFQSGLFSSDLTDVVMIGGQGALVRRKVTVSEEEESQVSIVLTTGGVRPQQILAWDQDKEIM